MTVSKRPPQPRGKPVYDKLIAAGETLLRSAAPDQITLADVLAEAEVARATVYHHFGDLDGLISKAALSLFAKFVEQDIELIGTLVASADSVDALSDALRQVTRASQSPERREIRLLRARLISYAASKPALEPMLAERQSALTGRMESVLASGQEKGLIRADLDARAMAVFLQAYTLGRVLDDVAAVQVQAEAWEELIHQVVTHSLLSR